MVRSQQDRPLAFEELTSTTKLLEFSVANEDAFSEEDGAAHSLDTHVSNKDGHPLIKSQSIFFVAALTLRTRIRSWTPRLPVLKILLYMQAATTAPTIGPTQYTECAVQWPSSAARANDMAGFMQPPVHSPATSRTATMSMVMRDHFLKVAFS